MKRSQGDGPAAMYRGWINLFARALIYDDEF